MRFMENWEICDKLSPLAAMFFDSSNVLSYLCRGSPIVTISAKSFSILTIGFRGQDI